MNHILLRAGRKLGTKMEIVTESSKVYIEQVLDTHAFHAYPSTVAFISTKKITTEFSGRPRR